MRLASVALAAAFVLLISSDVTASMTSEISQATAPGIPRKPTARQSTTTGKRFLRTIGATDEAASEERMFSVSTINGVLGKVGSVVETGGVKVVKEAPKLEKYQQWLNAGLSPAQVRVDVLKKAPWLNPSFLLNHEDFYQYAKFMVEFKRRQPGSTITKEASKMEKYELWMSLGLTPSQVRVDIMKKDPSMPAEYLLQHKDLYQYAKFMGEYEKLHPGTTPFLSKTFGQ